MTALNTRTLATLRPEVAVPAYDRARVTPGIVHFGVGGFHRAHQAMYLDALMNTGEAHDWGIVGVGSLPGDVRMRDALGSQDCLYTLVEKAPDGSLAPRVIGSIVDYVLAPDDPEAVLVWLVDQRIRIVSLTITEGGYSADSPTLAVIVEGLKRRRQAGVAPFAVLSCDNIPGNGAMARRTTAEVARREDPGLADWIESEVAFPNAMVDRITPVTTDADRADLSDRFDVEDAWPVVCEPFAQWVIEDHFPLGRPAWEKVGAQLVDDVEPYELMKLRLLNCGHQAIAYLGYLSGYRYAHEAVADPLFVELLLGYMENEGTPTLPPVPGVDLPAYWRELVERFGNSHIRDTLARLCAESSDRIPTWLLPVIQSQLRTGGTVHRSALIVASWARYAEGVDEKGEPIEIVDQRADAVRARAARQQEDPLAFLRAPDLFADLVDQPRFTEIYLDALRSLHEHGAHATLEAWVRR